MTDAPAPSDDTLAAAIRCATAELQRVIREANAAGLEVEIDSTYRAEPGAPHAWLTLTPVIRRTL